MEKKYKLFTSSKCAPRISVKNHLEKFKDLEKHVDIVDVTEIIKEDWIKIKEEYGIKYTPTLLNTETSTIVFWGYNPFAINDFIESISQLNEDSMKSVKSRAEKVGDATFEANITILSN